MPARVFRRIIKPFSTVSKTALLALFLFAAVSANASPVFAQSPEEKARNNFQLLYGPHLDLFSDSKFTYQGPLFSREKKLVNGFHFTFFVIIPKGSEEAFWTHIAAPRSDNDVFIIESCPATDRSKCAYTKVPYAEAPSASAWTSFKKGLWNNVDLLSTATGRPIASSIEAQYGVEIQGDLDNLLALFQKGTQGNWLQSREINILAADWFTINSDGSIKPQSTLDFIGTTSRVTELWYCGEAANSIDPSAAYKESLAGGGNANVATFGNLCEGKTFFKIAQTLVVPPQSIAEAVAQNASIVTADPNATVEKKGDDTNLPTCEINFSGDSKIVGCLARIVYYGLYWPLAWVAGLFGSLFDFFIGYSVSDESYRYAFAVNGWKLVRDIANVMFIVIMVYVGFAAVFSFGGGAASTMRKVIPILIINALIINFSLFATRTVIDISNITARVFYSRMVVCSGECKYKEGSSTPENIRRGLGGHWPLSEKIVGAFDPQRMFNTKILNPKETPTGGGNPEDPFVSKQSSDAGMLAEQGKGFAPDSNEYAGYYALVSVIAAAIMLGIAVMFFNVTFMFLGRVIGLYMAMIFSPFAFLTRGGMPLFKIDGYTWDSWLKDLFNYAALAPVFIFFLYIVYSFLNTDIVKQIGVEDTTGGFFGTVLSIVIPMLFIYFLISKGVKIAEKYSGEFGKKVQGWGNTITGFAAGATTGGAAFLGSNTMGRAMNKLSENERFKDWAGKNGRMGRMALKSVDSMGKSSFDARKTKLVESGSKQFGINLDQKQLGMIGLDTKASKGGYRQVQEDKVKSAEAYKKLLVSKKSDDEMKATYTQEQLQKRAVYDNTSDTLLMNRWKQKVVADAAERNEQVTPQMISKGAWQDYKKSGKTKADYEKMKDSYQKTVPPPIHLTTAERNKARTNAYAETKERRSGGAFATQDYYNKQGNLVYKKGELARNPYADDDLYTTSSDAKNNVAPIARKGEKIAKKNSQAAIMELAEGATKGAIIGGVIGSVVPIVGTTIGAAVGGALGAIKQGLNYSGTTNKRIGKTVRTEEKKKDKIIDDLINEMGGGTPPPAAPAPAPAGGGGPTPPPTTP